VGLLTTGYTVVDIGEPVASAFSGKVVTSAVMSETSRCVRFVTDDATYVWDYSDAKQSRWTRYTFTARGSWAYRGLAAHAHASGSVWVENLAAYSDAGRRYRFRAATGWLAPGEKLADGRLRRWGLVGTCRGAHKLHCEVAYNWNDNTVDQGTWAPNADYDAPNVHWGYGADENWPPDNPMEPEQGGSYALLNYASYASPPYLLTGVFATSRVASLRFFFDDNFAAGASFSLAAISIEGDPRKRLVRTGTRNFSR
jgi:hypothetical protein